MQWQNNGANEFIPCPLDSNNHTCYSGGGDNNKGANRRISALKGVITKMKKRVL